MSTRPGLRLGVLLLSASFASSSGCAALRGESAAEKRWRDIVAQPLPVDPADTVAGPSPPTEEEEAIRHKPSLGLDDCLRLAVVRNEHLRAGAERVHQLDLHEDEGYTTLGPSATYQFQYFRQDPSVQSQLVQDQSRLHRVQLHQPIFRGFREYFGLAAIRDREEAAAATLRADKLEVALNCGRAFYAVVSLERSVDTLESSLKLEDERFAEVRARETSGIARRTETLFVESERARTEADLARARHDLAAARAHLAFYTGLPAAPLTAASTAPPAPPSVDVYLTATKDRPDVAALAHEVEARRHEISVARGEFLPNADVNANSYIHREGFFHESNWDMTLELDWPIFEMGKTLVHIRLAQSRVREAEREYADARDRARTDVESAYQNLLASLAQIPALETRVRSSEENVRLLDAEYRTGIATNLEAVEAENTRRQARLDLERELYNARRLEIELRAVSGDESLAPNPYPSSPRDQ